MFLKSGWKSRACNKLIQTLEYLHGDIKMDEVRPQQSIRGKISEWFTSFKWPRECIFLVKCVPKGITGVSVAELCYSQPQSDTHRHVVVVSVSLSENEEWLRKSARSALSCKGDLHARFGQFWKYPVAGSLSQIQRAVFSKSKLPFRSESSVFFRKQVSANWIRFQSNAIWKRRGELAIRQCFRSF